MKKIYPQAHSILMNGLDLILPPRCPVTGDVVDLQGMMSPAAWSGLEFITDPLCLHCGVPLQFVSGAKCLPCLENPPVFHSARSAFKYNDISRNMILGFKHGDKTHIVQSFVPWLGQAGRIMLQSADYLVPVPLHPLRLISRRYNQAALMGHALSKSTSIPHLPLAMKRIRSTPSQGHLSTNERVRNVHRAFDVAPVHRDVLKNKSVILIDDVYTTGATAQECTKVLLKYGVADVHVLTLARVVHAV